eukprot:TRINITY_DN2341_c0_g6_i1.p1 TRINITY_DN2341_c0_g6~~TRINITY_DN2341_c0_g6_i1.p1  ORF type:complete len:458 (-),score=75.34 TRINITY_DN2341_c0_g6_i1:132-1505(-)
MQSPRTMRTRRLEPLLPWLVRSVVVCLIFSTLVEYSQTSRRSSSMRLKHLQEIRHQRKNADGGDTPGSESAQVGESVSKRMVVKASNESNDGPFNTDVAKYFAREGARSSQQFLPLRLRGGYTGLHATYSAPRISPDHPVLFLAIGILTGPTTRSRGLRDSIRQSWGKTPESMHQGQAVMYRFFAALPPKSIFPGRFALLSELEDEAIEHGDMIILGHKDSFSAISKKTIAIMTWGSDLSGAYFVAKTDDDTFVNIPNAVSWLLRHGKENGMFAGLSSKAYLPTRIKKHPFYVSSSEFPFDKGGCYLQGAFFVASRDVASHIGALRNQPTYVWNRNEDVMAAMRVREAGGVTTTTDGSDCFIAMPILSYTDIGNCKKLVVHSQERNGDEPIVAFHGLDVGMMIQVYKNVENDEDICRDVIMTKRRTRFPPDVTKTGYVSPTKKTSHVLPISVRGERL